MRSKYALVYAHNGGRHEVTCCLYRGHQEILYAVTCGKQTSKHNEGRQSDRIRWSKLSLLTFQNLLRDCRNVGADSAVGSYHVNSVQHKCTFTTEG